MHTEEQKEDWKKLSSDTAQVAMKLLRSVLSAYDVAFKTIKLSNTSSLNNECIAVFHCNNTHAYSISRYFETVSGLYPGIFSPNPVSEGSLSAAFEGTQPIPPRTPARAGVQVSCEVTLAMKRFSVLKISSRPISTCALTQLVLAELAAVFSLL